MPNDHPRGASYFICGDGEPAELNRCSGDVLFPAARRLSRLPDGAGITSFQGQNGPPRNPRRS